MYSEYIIMYTNPNIIPIFFKRFPETIKARNTEEAEKKAFKKMRNFGMCFKVIKMEGN